MRAPEPRVWRSHPVLLKYQRVVDAEKKKAAKAKAAPEKPRKSAARK